MLTLVRKFETDGGTFGVLYFNGSEVCKTLEKEWLDNEKFVSCVPVGIYELEKHESDKYGSTVALISDILNVTHQDEEGSERYAILIHGANIPTQLAGCLAMGETYCHIMGSYGVCNSSKNVKKVLRIIEAYEIKQIEIINDANFKH
jgi:hypothetical protein